MISGLSLGIRHIIVELGACLGAVVTSGGDPAKHHEIARHMMHFFFRGLPHHSCCELIFSASDLGATMREAHLSVGNLLCETR